MMECKGSCRSPLACGSFGHCRDLHTVFRLELYDVGKPPKDVTVIGKDGLRQRALFSSAYDAKQAASIIEGLRLDSAFRKIVIIEETRG